MAGTISRCAPVRALLNEYSRLAGARNSRLCSLFPPLPLLNDGNNRGQPQTKAEFPGKIFPGKVSEISSPYVGGIFYSHTSSSIKGIFGFQAVFNGELQGLAMSFSKVCHAREGLVPGKRMDICGNCCY